MFPKRSPESGSESDAAEIMALVGRIHPLLADRSREVQRGVLADLLAMWLAGHVVPSDANATRTLRATLLATHSSLVRQLVEVNARIMGTWVEENNGV